MIQKAQIPARLGLVARRLLATVADAVVLLAFVAIFTLAAAWLAVTIKDQPSMEQLQVLFQGVPNDRLSYAWYEAIARGIAPYVLAASPAIWWLYESLFSWGKVKCTPGKWLLCLKTTSSKDRDARLGETLMRSAMKVMTVLCLLFISSPVFLAVVAILLLLIPLLSTRGQFLHDFIPGTNVVTKANWRAWLSRKPA
ncbi:RDD family protein [Cupriavidus sp. TMH.W2]|uniref:RDD family protein n=1 Tax=Cupriavidus sp. TMH.W2 TaxID=3434465 RepID=UPI003D780D73